MDVERRKSRNHPDQSFLLCKGTRDVHETVNRWYTTYQIYYPHFACTYIVTTADLHKLAPPCLSSIVMILALVSVEDANSDRSGCRRECAIGQALFRGMLSEWACNGNLCCSISMEPMSSQSNVKRRHVLVEIWELPLLLCGQAEPQGTDHWRLRSVLQLSGLTYDIGPFLKMRRRIEV